MFGAKLIVTGCAVFASDVVNDKTDNENGGGFINEIVPAWEK
jgi:hypothetical protein